MPKYRHLFIVLALLAAGTGYAQTTASDKTAESDQLKLAALEALVAAPGDRALPIVAKVIAGNNSDEVKYTKSTSELSANQEEAQP